MKQKGQIISRIGAMLLVTAGLNHAIMGYKPCKDRFCQDRPASSDDGTILSYVYE